MAEKTKKRKYNQGLVSLPKIKINVESLLRKTEARTKSIYVTYPSDVEDYGYIAVADEGVLVITRDDGYVRIPIYNLDTFVEEITWVKEDLSRRRRM